MLPELQHHTSQFRASSQIPTLALQLHRTENLHSGACPPWCALCLILWQSERPLRLVVAHAHKLEPSAPGKALTRPHARARSLDFFKGLVRRKAPE